MTVMNLDGIFAKLIETLSHTHMYTNIIKELSTHPEVDCVVFIKCLKAFFFFLSKMQIRFYFIEQKLKIMCDNLAYKRYESTHFLAIRKI